MESLITTYGEAKDIIRKDLESMSKKFITIGYYLKYIRDKKLYIQDEFESIWEFAQDTYGISKSTCSRWIHMNDKFSEGGNSPELRQEFASFGKSQLQEMLYLDDKQIEQAKPEMTAKEIREIRKPQNQEENLEGQMEIQEFLEQEAGADDSRENVQDISTITEEELKEEPEETIPEEIQEKEQQKEKTILKKPSEQEREYLKLLAKHLIKSMYSWFLEDYTNRVLMVSKSPEEIKRKLGINHRTRYFSTEKGAAHANLFDNYVQLWDEKSNYIGDYDWFYLAAAIQSMWNKVGLERIRKTAAEPEKITVEVVPGIEAEITDVKKATKAAKIEEKKAEIEAIRDISIAPAQQHEENEERQEASEETFKEWTPKEILEEKQEELNRWIEAFAGEEEPEAIKKQRIIVDALEYMIKNLQQEEQQEQPLIPKLKNNDKRKKWLRNYRDWGIWYKDEHIGATYYRYQFENGTTLIVEEYENESGYTGTYISSYFHLVGGPEPPRKNRIPKWNTHKTYNRFPNSETELVEFLKEIQKG